MEFINKILVFYVDVEEYFGYVILLKGILRVMIFVFLFLFFLKELGNYFIYWM